MLADITSDLLFVKKDKSLNKNVLLNRYHFRTIDELINELNQYRPVINRLMYMIIIINRYKPTPMPSGD